jgi:NitT/TauT family transport system substrate-binding protein
VQALSLWDSAYTEMEENGIEFDKVIQDPRAEYFVAGSLTVNEQDLTDRRDALIGLARGIAKAQLFQEYNPEASVRIHWTVYPQSAPREVTDEAIAKEVAIIATRTDIQSEDIVGTGNFGDIPPENMEAFQAYLKAVGELDEEIDVGRYYTNELIDEINDFDRQAIIERAQSFEMPE